MVVVFIKANVQSKMKEAVWLAGLGCWSVNPKVPHSPPPCWILFSVVLGSVP